LEDDVIEKPGRRRKPKDPTAAERQRRRRAKQREAEAVLPVPVTPTDPPMLPAAVTPNLPMVVDDTVTSAVSPAWKRIFSVKWPAKSHGSHGGSHGTSLAAMLTAAILFLAALDLVGSGLVMNARYAASLGSGEGATIQAAIGIAIDAIALVLLSAGYLLWSNGHRRFAVLAWIVWPAMLGLSLMNTIGFSATHISDALARRSAVVTAATNKATAASYTASDLQDWRTERKGITEKRTVDELKIQFALDRRKVDRIDRDAFEVTFGCTRVTADTMKACAPVLPTLQALVVARHRDDLTKQISDAEKPQKGASTTDGNQKSTTTTAEGNQESTTTIASADPQTETIPKLVTWITRGWIAPTPDDIALVRVLGLTVPPCLAGLFLMFATALLVPARTA
jgi:hypothetical protein